MNNKVTQEQKCLEVKSLINILKTRLLEIDEFKDFDYYETILEELKKNITRIYWEL